MGDGVKGIVMGFDQDDVLVLALGDSSKLRMGKEVVGISEPFKIPVGEGLTGRMVTALSEPCDNRAPIEAQDHIPVFRDSPPIIHREQINEFLPTGTKIIDMLVPLAKGQRQLILGDRMTGKTTLAVDAVLTQKGRNVLCIYCCVGKSMSALEKVVKALNEHEALEYTTVVVATDNAPVGEQYIVPFAAASMADWFALKGRDVLVVFDDLTKHAWSYRQLSLLLERPPGREAYPGDIFYIQTQLMERAGKFNQHHGKGSVTFLGIAETLQGDMTGYIPSNLVSMCDGQVCLNSTIFAEGFRPAIDIGISLSIAGARTQPPILKTMVGSMRSDYARYNEIIKLSKLSTGLSEEAARLMKRGEAIKSILQQSEFAPIPVAEDLFLLYLLTRSEFLEMKPADKMKAAREIYKFALENNGAFVGKLAEAGELAGDIQAGLKEVGDAFFAVFKKEE
jgi:F-type H+-transporting ATPase subunit alpha